MSFNDVIPETCRLDALKRFLKLKNWSIADVTDTCLIYEGPLDDLKHPIRVVLPPSAEFGDTSRLIEKALKLLAAIDRCSIPSICQTIMNLGSDFLRTRIITPSNTPNISLTVAKEIIQNFYGLICDAACLEEDCQPFFAKRRNIGKKYAERCRLGQTFIGSYGLVIEMPISPASPENTEQIPFERRIMIRIAQGLLAMRKSSQEADVSILTTNYKQGFNANLYETMQYLMQSLQDCQVEFSFSWSPEYALPQALTTMPAMRFVPDSVLPFLESAAKTLRRNSESQDIAITKPAV